MTAVKKMTALRRTHGGGVGEREEGEVLKKASRDGRKRAGTDESEQGRTKASRDGRKRAGTEESEQGRRGRGRGGG